MVNSVCETEDIISLSYMFLLSNTLLIQTCPLKSYNLPQVNTLDMCHELIDFEGQ
jgi:hypothetical protein